MIYIDCLSVSEIPQLGKTRFGQDLFDHVKKNLDIPEIWSDLFDVHYEYLYIDFGNGFALDELDYNLTPDVIIGLRIAYAFYIEREYDVKFSEFRRAATRQDKHLFGIDTVIQMCRKSLSLSDQQQFFLYLHIDEFQLITAWDDNEKTKEKNLFKNMVRHLAKYMIGTSSISDTFIQPFFSGTTSYAIVAQQDSSSV